MERHCVQLGREWGVCVFMVNYRAGTVCTVIYGAVVCVCVCVCVFVCVSVCAGGLIRSIA